MCIAAGSLCASCGDPIGDREPIGAAAQLCASDDSEPERHGTDCLCCHTDSFTVAGSVQSSPRGSRVDEVLVVDAEGQLTSMGINPYGNFFQHVPVTVPLTAAIRWSDGSERWMTHPAPHGSCNRCHRLGGETLPLGAR